MAEAFRILKKMKPLRQVEVAELLISSGNYSMPYLRALYAATNRDLLIPGTEAKKAFGLTPEQLGKMEREVEGLQRELKLIEESHGTETLNLAIASSGAGLLAAADEQHARDALPRPAPQGPAGGAEDGR